MYLEHVQYKFKAEGFIKHKEFTPSTVGRTGSFEEVEIVGKRGFLADLWMDSLPAGSILLELEPLKGPIE